MVINRVLDVSEGPILGFGNWVFRAEAKKN